MTTVQYLTTFTKINNMKMSILIILLFGLLNASAQKFVKDYKKSIEAMSEDCLITYYAGENCFSYWRNDRYGKSKVFVYHDDKDKILKILFSQSFIQTSQRLIGINQGVSRGKTDKDVTATNTYCSPRSLRPNTVVKVPLI